MDSFELSLLSFLAICVVISAFNIWLVKKWQREDEQRFKKWQERMIEDLWKDD